MLISVRWLNRLLRPADLTPDEAEAVLTNMGFPIETREDLAGGDARLDVEVTSNRGDVLCHVGCAREIAAATGRQLVAPPADVAPEDPGEAARAAGVENLAPDACPLFTARLIRGVKVGPSPAWLVQALEAVGQRPINNVVDASNYVLFEMGHPTHAFDFATLRGGRIVVRRAHEGEPLVALDGRRLSLRADEMVVADAERAVSLAGIIGGLETAVTERTTDVLLEAATWDPPTVRRAARRLQIRTDAGHRYERFVDARTTAAASRRVAELIVEVAGGRLVPGVIAAGAPLRQRSVVSLRASRCRALAGADIPTTEMARLLTALEIDAHVDVAAGALRCEIPPHRPDLTREVDLIEEVVRTHGLGRIPTSEKISIRARPPQDAERAARDLASALTGMGFYETVTFSFVSREDAAMFMPAGMRALEVDESRRAGEPALRPSVAPSLLRRLRDNRNAGARAEGGVRFFETASVFAEAETFPGKGPGGAAETRVLALLLEGQKGDAQGALRALRGAIENAARALGGPDAAVSAEPAAPAFVGAAEGASAAVRIAGRHAGWLGLVSDRALRWFDVEGPVAVAEIGLEALLSLHPARVALRALPAFPGVERDVSVVVDEAVAWSALERAALGAQPAMLEGVEFVGTYRGRQVGEGKKSVTLRLRFRDPSRTLRREEVDPQVAGVVDALARAAGATLRA